MLLKSFKYVLPFLLFCLAGTAHASDACTNNKINGRRGKSYVAKSLSQDNQSEIPQIRRKYKAKGLQVLVPFIPHLSFKKFDLPSECPVRVNDETRSSFLFCVRHKRGPPSV